MGSSSSSRGSDNSGNILGNLINIRTGNLSFSSAPGSVTNSTVANATGKKLRIFYHKAEIKLEDLLAKADSGTTKKIFKPNAKINFFDLPPNQYIEVPSLEDGFASIFVADAEDSEVYIETIALNFEVPYGSCCIVTANKEIKFRKSDGGIWIDEDGHDHSTK